MIIQYYADSLGLPRPTVVSLNQRYIFLFELWLRKITNQEIFVIDRAKGGATLDELFNIFKHDEEYIKGIKDILIIHEGICDCAPRPVPSSVRKIISSLPDILRVRIISFLHRNRSKLLNKGFVFYKTESHLYESKLLEWLTIALNSFKVIYVFNIAPTNSATECHSPGLTKGIENYNTILAKVIDKINDPKIKLINIHKMISERTQSIDDFIIKEDGHHLTAVAHQMCFEELIRLEEKRIEIIC